MLLRRLWCYVFHQAVMRDADRLIEAHGAGAYGMARVGARAARETGPRGHWTRVSVEIARRTGKITDRD